MFEGIKTVLVPTGVGEQSCREVGRSVCVIAYWAGDRRQIPATGVETNTMLKAHLGAALTLDYGVPTDTLLVNSLSTTNVTDKESYEQSRKMILSFDGYKTPNGVVRVLERENGGMSFGSFSDAYYTYAAEYDYWMFMEDDQIPVADGVMKTAITMLQQNPTAGFIATWKPWRTRRKWFAMGGCGVTSREVLAEICVINNGQLPHYNPKGQDYPQGVQHGEIPFTAILGDRLGRRILKYPANDAFVLWGRADGKSWTPDDTEALHDELLAKYETIKLL